MHDKAVCNICQAIVTGNPFYALDPCDHIYCKGCVNDNKIDINL